MYSVVITSLENLPRNYRLTRLLIEVPSSYTMRVMAVMTRERFACIRPDMAMYKNTLAKQ